MPGSIAAALPAVANVAGSVIGGMNSSNAASTAAQAQEAAQQANLTRANGVWTKTQGNLDPTIQGGQGALSTEQGLLGLGTPQQAGSANASFQNFLDSTGYGFQFGQGEQALSNANAMSFNSGATGKALLNYGQQAGRGALQGYIGNLDNLQNRGVSAAGTEGQIGQNYVQQAGGFQTALANAVGGNAYGQANANTGLTQGILGQVPSLGGALSSFAQTPPATTSISTAGIPETLPVGADFQMPNTAISGTGVLPQITGNQNTMPDRPDPNHVIVGAGESAPAGGALSPMNIPGL